MKPAAIFDLGGVVIEWEPRAAYCRAFPGQEARIDKFLGSVFSEVALQSCEVPGTLVEIARPFAAKHPQYQDLIEFFANDWGNFVIGPMTESVELLRRLAANQVELFALTNWPEETYPPAGKQFDFLDLFSQTVVSGAVGMRKPDRAIFELALARFETEPERVIYVDDRPENVASAVTMGMVGHHFQSATGFEAFLVTEGLLDVPSTT